MQRPPSGRRWLAPAIIILVLLLLLIAAGTFVLTRGSAGTTIAQGTSPPTGSNGANTPTDSTPGAAGPAGGSPAAASPSPAAGSSLAGRVVDQQSGQAVAGATVTAAGVTTQTAADGSFSLAVSAPDAPLAIRASGYDPIEVAATGDLSRLALRPNVFSGRVVDAATGEPVPGAIVAAGNRSITSTVSGDFSLSDLPKEARVTVSAGGYERVNVASLDAPSTTVKLNPWTARGIYATVFGIADRGLRAGMDEVLTDTTLNAIVIDVKGDRAGILYPSKVPVAEKIGANELNTLEEGDIEEMIRKYHERDIYVIARIVVFKDDNLARNGQAAGLDVAIKKSDGTPWVDGEDLAWVDPTREEAWDYTIAIAKEAAEKGFDEVQYDYIRFPTDPAAGTSVNAALYSKPNTEENRVAAIAGFLKRSDEVLRPLGVASSIDTFGYTTWRYDDTGIGQNMSVLADYVDFISPMVYPSTYNSGLPEPLIEYPEVVNHPYDVVYESVKRAVDRTQGKRAKIRPWLQYFDDYPWQTDKTYGPEEIGAQVQAVIDAGAAGYLFWDPFNEYEHGAIFEDTLPEPRVKQPTPTPAPAASPAGSPRTGAN